MEAEQAKEEPVVIEEATAATDPETPAEAVKDLEPKEEPAREETIEKPKEDETNTAKEEPKAEEQSIPSQEASSDNPPDLETIQEESTSGSANATDDKKEKKKKVKVKVDQVDKAGKEEKSDLEGDMGTLFILDLMRQKREKMMRKKKDDLINEMAMKKKQMMMEAKMGKRVLTRPAFGGFVGVSAILAGSKPASPSSRRRTPKPEMRQPEVEIPPSERTDLLIMGIIRDKKEEKFHEAHHVRFQIWLKRSSISACKIPTGLIFSGQDGAGWRSKWRKMAGKVRRLTFL